MYSKLEKVKQLFFYPRSLGMVLEHRLYRGDQMLLWIILTVLAAFGLLCAGWALFGVFLRGQRGAAMVCICRGAEQEEQILRHCAWLRDLGLFRGPLLLVDAGMTPEARSRLLRWGRGGEICTIEELASRLEQERNRLDRRT